jgi:UDP-N-acetyl-D-glucosamine/UDP-N-acetyl-D-galactosamine dehydrogenase
MFKKNKIRACIIGLGYVGLPLAIAFAKKLPVKGYDFDTKKVEELKKGYDRSGEISKKEMKAVKVIYSDNEKLIKDCNFIIVAVPTPIDHAKNPDLKPLISASKKIGKNLSKNSIIVFESTVYPGVTEEICIPIIEKESGLRYMIDFKVGYSPERINPGDKIHTIEKVIKVISGCDKDATAIITKVYKLVTKAGIYKAKSIKVAEAAKVIENIQRDINIALINELKVIFDQMNININDVLEAAKTKWNVIKLKPGLVGGHCIGVDPYYLAYKARLLGIHPEMILAGRKINDFMVKYHSDKIIKELINKGIKIKGAKILVLGVTFKPDVKDTRNSKVKDLIQNLKIYGCRIIVCEPMLNGKDNVFGQKNIPLNKIKLDDYDFIIKAVNHTNFKNLKADYII